MGDLLDVLAAWGAYDVAKSKEEATGKVRRKRRADTSDDDDEPSTKTKKLYKDRIKPYDPVVEVPMEGPSRDYIKEREKYDKAKYRKDIQTSIEKNDGKADDDKSDAPMEGISKEWFKQYDRIDREQRAREIRDAQTGGTTSDGKVIRPPRRQVEEPSDAPMRGPSETFIREKEKLDRLRERQAVRESLKGRVRNTDPESVVARPVEASQDPVEAPQSTAESLVPFEVAGTRPFLEPRLKEGEAVAGVPGKEAPVTSTTITPPNDVSDSVISAARTAPPSLEPTQPVVAPAQPDTPAPPDAPPTAEEVPEPSPPPYVPVQPPTLAPPPKAEQAPAPVVQAPPDASLPQKVEQPRPDSISVAGINVPKGTVAFDAADKVLRTTQSANGGLYGATAGIARAVNYIYWPVDKALGTNFQERANRPTDAAEKWLKSVHLIKDPENWPERAAFALGAVTLPIPGAAVSKTTAGTVGQLIAEAVTPGTFIRGGRSIADAYKISAPATVAVAEGIHQILTNVEHLKKVNPPKPNSLGDVEPPVTSVPAGEAKELQKKVDEQKNSFITKFAEANYYGPAIAGVAGLAALYGLFRYTRTMRQPVAGEVIRDPTNVPAAGPVPSVTTPHEAFRSMAQSDAYVVESQARRAAEETARLGRQTDTNLTYDVTTQTRSGVEARKDYAHETGTVETPRSNIQLPVSPKALIEEHMSRPPQQIEEVARSIATLDQADQAAIRAAEHNRAVQAAMRRNRTPPPTPDTGMPSATELAEARRVLSQPENVGIARGNRAIGDATIDLLERAGRFTPAEAREIRLSRPNYAHAMESGNIIVENGVARPMTRWERVRDAMWRSEAREVRADDIADELSLGRVERARNVDGPTSRIDPIASNITALREAMEFAHTNDITKRFVDQVRNAPSMRASLRPLRANQAVPEASKLVTYWENGVQRRFAAEPLVAASLAQNPYRATRALTALKNMEQTLITGKLAPWYGFQSMVMEASLGSVTRMRGTRLGYIDQALQAATGGRLAGRGDYLGAMAAGVVEAMNSRRQATLHASIERLERDIIRDPSLASAPIMTAIDQYPRRLAQGLAVGHNSVMQDLLENARRVYSDTPKAYAQRIGALHSSQNELRRNIFELDKKAVANDLAQSMGTPDGARYLKNIFHYGTLIDDMHDAIKIHYVRANRAAVNAGRISASQLAHETRNIGGDLGKRGLNVRDANYRLADNSNPVATAAVKAFKHSGPGFDFVRDSTIYFNPHFQGMARFFEAARRNPAATIGAVTAGTTMPYMASLAASLAAGPEYADYLLNRRSEHWKTNYVYFPIPGKPPDQGINLRIDPVFAPFGYPAVEMADAIFGIRKYVAAKLGQQAIPQEQEGVARALLDGMREFVNIGYPWPFQVGAAAAGVAPRQILTNSFSVHPENISGVGTGGITVSSTMSQPVQMVLENILGVTGKAGYHAMEAAVSAMQNKQASMPPVAAAKQFAHEVGPEVPGYGAFFGGTRAYSKFDTTLSQRMYEHIQAGEKVGRALKVYNNQLLQTSSNAPLRGAEVPNLQMGDRSHLHIPPDVQEDWVKVSPLFAKGGPVMDMYRERKRIRNDMTGLRGVNAGNIGRMVIVPKAEGSIAGIDYGIWDKGDLFREAKAELEARASPNKTKNGSIAAESRQRPRPLQGFAGVLPTNDEELNKLRSEKKVSKSPMWNVPTLTQKRDLENGLNRRAYNLDKNVAVAINETEQKTGVSIKALASKIKLSDDDDSDAE
jgi:hypothetical protein